MDFDKFLKTEANKIQSIEQKHLKAWFNWLSKKVPSLTPHARAFITSCNGGKKIRGALINLGYQIARKSSVHQSSIGTGRQSSEKTEDIAILDIAAAYEIFHSSILAHDDIIDQSVLRRGKPSLYQALGGGHLGISQAICLADLGFFLAIKIISESKFDAKRQRDALNLFSKTMIDTAMGQMLDVAHGEAELVAKFKTARYTIAAPLQLGATFGGADERLLGQLGLFGENLGIAFQIQDDILDGEASQTDYAKALVYISKGKKIIPQLTKDAKMSKLLTQMANYLVQRTK